MAIILRNNSRTQSSRQKALWPRLRNNRCYVFSGLHFVQKINMQQNNYLQSPSEIIGTTAKNGVVPVATSNEHPI